MSSKIYELENRQLTLNYPPPPQYFGETMLEVEGVREDKLNWNDKASELEHFSIIRQPPTTILGKGKADVKFEYKNNKKTLIIYGPEDAVFERAMTILFRKRQAASIVKMQSVFQKKWKEAAYHKFSSYKDKVKNIEDIKLMNDFLIEKFYEGRKRNPLEPKTLLEDEITKKWYDVQSFSEDIKKNPSTVYFHTSGKREISKKVAMEYATKLKCDPVDLMFEKKSIPVWAKVNLLKPSELEETYNPGRIFSYYADDKNIEQVIVPRDIYQDDIKAIKIQARGSMYDNQVAFYYRATSKDDNCLNKLCIVSIEVPVGPKELSEDTEDHYYFGLYENIRGESNLINPDPYVDVYKNKFILKNFTPKIIAPVIALINPEAITDKTKMRGSIPPAALIREEERLQAEIAALKKFQEVGKKTREIADKSEKIYEEMKKIQERIKLLTGGAYNHPFQKDFEALDNVRKLHPFAKFSKRKN